MPVICRKDNCIICEKVISDPTLYDDISHGYICHDCYCRHYIGRKNSENIGMKNNEEYEKEKNNMIKIVFKNGNYEKWTGKNFTDYKYDGKCFIVMKDTKWVGIYNIDSIISIVISD